MLPDVVKLLFYFLIHFSVPQKQASASTLHISTKALLREASSRFQLLTQPAFSIMSIRKHQMFLWDNSAFNSAS